MTKSLFTYTFFSLSLLLSASTFAMEKAKDVAVETGKTAQNVAIDVKDGVVGVGTAAGHTAVNITTDVIDGAKDAGHAIKDAAINVKDDVVAGAHNVHDVVRSKPALTTSIKNQWHAFTKAIADRKDAVVAELVSLKERGWNAWTTKEKVFVVGGVAAAAGLTYYIINKIMNKKKKATVEVVITTHEHPHHHHIG